MKAATNEQRAALANALSAAHHRTVKALERVWAAEKALHASDINVDHARAKYFEVRAKALDPSTDPDLRSVAVYDANRFIESIADLERARHAARSELGTARAELERATAEQAAAHKRLDDALPLFEGADAR